MNAMLHEAPENDFLSKLVRGPIGDNVVWVFFFLRNLGNSGLGCLSAMTFIHLTVKDVDRVARKVFST